MNADFEDLQEIASKYADPGETEALVEAALSRRDWRARRAGAKPCVVCGAPLIARRSDAETCSGACREKRRYWRARS